MMYAFFKYDPCPYIVVARFRVLDDDHRLHCRQRCRRRRTSFHLVFGCSASCRRCFASPSVDRNRNPSDSA